MLLLKRVPRNYICNYFSRTDSFQFGPAYQLLRTVKAKKINADFVNMNDEQKSMLALTNTEIAILTAKTAKIYFSHVLVLCIINKVLQIQTVFYSK
jgi:hypothetical protein